MTTPFDNLQNYRPGGGALAPVTLSTGTKSSDSLIKDYFYQVRGTVDCWIAVASSAVTAGSTTAEYLPASDEWSLSFCAKDGDKVYARRTREMSLNGKLYLRRLGHV